MFAYYKEVIAVESSHGLLPLMKRWMEEFPTTSHDIEEFSSLNDYESDPAVYSDFLFMNEAETLISPDIFEGLVEGLENILDGEKRSKKVFGGHGLPALIQDADKESELLAEEPLSVVFDEDKAKMLYDQIEKLFVIPEQYAATVIPTNRMNVKRVA